MRSKNLKMFFTSTLCLLLVGVAPWSQALETTSQKEVALGQGHIQIAAAAGSTKGTAGEKAAVVNGKVITMDRLNSEMKRFEHHLARMGQSPDEGQLAEIRLIVLENFINRELLVQESQKQGISISDREVDDQIGAIKAGFGDEKAFQSHLAQMELTEGAFKAQVAEEMAIEKLLAVQMTDKVAVTEKEARSFYDSRSELFDAPERVRASHILVRVSPDAGDGDKKKAEKKIQDILARVKKGESFEALAGEHSDCPSSERGGDLGYFSKDRMVAPFADAAFALKPGEVSGVVETQFGYHIIKVTDRKEAGLTPYEEVSERIEQHLEQEKMSKGKDEYILALRARAKIETFIQ